MKTDRVFKNNIEKTGHKVSVRRRPVPDARTRFIWPNSSRPFNINVLKDKKGEFFGIDIREDVDAKVLHVEDDHALLMFTDDATKLKALIGHDERQLFVAAVPDGPVSTVHDAKEALKPDRISRLEKGVKKKDKHKRRTKDRLRQGDFFFVPVPSIAQDAIIHTNEPINRGRGTSHICEELVRYGGENRYFNPRTIRDHPSGITDRQRNALFDLNPKARRWNWEVRKGGNIQVFVRGKIRHPEHTTLNLRSWHQVIPNTEAGWIGNIDFVD